MKKNQFYTLITSMLLLTAPAFAQVKIGANPTTVTPSAVLELESSSKAFRLTRVALTGINDVATVSAPVTGMLVYNTAAAGSGTTAVLANQIYQFNGTVWDLLISNSYSSTSATQFIPKTRLAARGNATQTFLDGTITDLALNIFTVNDGSYNTATSMFVAPENGTYLFSSKIIETPVNAGATNFELIINDLTVASTKISYPYVGVIGGTAAIYLTAGTGVHFYAGTCAGCGVTYNSSNREVSVVQLSQ